jgi:hypothetical protein
LFGKKKDKKQGQRYDSRAGYCGKEVRTERMPHGGMMVTTRCTRPRNHPGSCA